MNTQTAVFAGGCFWCLEAVFGRVKGVLKVTSGYAGGGKENPTYEQVSGGCTGYAEVVRIEFVAEVISYRVLLEIFFTIHDPSTLNRQGNDVGEQYRSAIFYTNGGQKQEAEKYIAELSTSNEYDDSIVTQIQPLDKFYTAEEYHQNYFNSNPEQPYCQLVISPKIKKFEKKFKNLLKD